MASIQQTIVPRTFSQDFTGDPFQVAGAPSKGTFAALTVDPAGDDNALVITAQDRGTGGNAITIQYAAAAQIGDITTTEVTSDAILVKCRKDGGGIIATANEVAAAIVNNPDSRALVRTENAANNDGTGIVDTSGPTNLAGGIDSDVAQAWAKLQTSIRAGQRAEFWGVAVKTPFELAGMGDVNDLALWIFQAAKGGQAAAWYPSLFRSLVPTDGGAISKARSLAADITGWYGTGLGSDDFVLNETAMKASAYTLTNANLPANVSPRKLTLTHATVTTAPTDTDTLGDAVIVGLDEDGAVLTETITLVADSTVTTSSRFASLTSITTAGWVVDGAAGIADRIKVGYAADGVDPELDADLYLVLTSHDGNDLSGILGPTNAGEFVAKVNTLG